MDVNLNKRLSLRAKQMYTVEQKYRPCVGYIHVQRNPSLFLFASVRTQDGLFLTPLILLLLLRLP